MYSDGVCFEGKEEHVWMSNAGFEKFEVGDCVSFFAEVYRYVKTGSGKQIDFSLRYPKGIQRVDKYSLPTDDDLDRQAINEIICETCYLAEHCNRMYCVLSKSERKSKQKQMIALLKKTKENPKQQDGEQQ